MLNLISIEERLEKKRIKKMIQEHVILILLIIMALLKTLKIDNFEINFAS